VQPQGTGDEAAPDQWRVIVTEGRRGYEGHILLLDQTSELPEQYIADVKGRFSAPRRRSGRPPRG
jgi:hypothetical protein